MSIICPYKPYASYIIPFIKGGLIGPVLLGARLSPPSSSAEYGLLWCSYLVHLVHIKSLYKVVRILGGPALLRPRLSPGRLRQNCREPRCCRDPGPFQLFVTFLFKKNLFWGGGGLILQQQKKSQELLTLCYFMGDQWWKSKKFLNSVVSKKTCDF